MMTGNTPGFVLGVGVDVESVERFRAIPESLFTAAEFEAASRYPDPSHSLAGTWCAKEAVAKALGRWGPIPVRDIEILRDNDGRPVARVCPVPDEWEGQIDVSISHSAGLAMAVAVVVIGDSTQPAGPRGRK